MPRRFIQESCRRSPTLDSLSAEAERLFWRLTTVADDYGRFPADPRELLASCFPLRVGSWKPSRVGSWYAELEGSGLVMSYLAEDHLCGEFKKWQVHQGPPRAEKSRFPSPTEDGVSAARSCTQMRADVHVVRSSVLGTTVKADHDLSVPGKGTGQPDAFEQFWQDYPKPRRKGKFEARRAWTAMRPNADTVTRIMRSLAAWKASLDWRKQDGKFVPWPQKFLNRRRWEESPEADQPRRGPDELEDL